MSDQSADFSRRMTALEKRSVFSLAGIFGLRMFGLFLVLPVLSTFALDLHGSTPFLIGLALGIYGLTQACLQIPFGMLSDRIGRKRVITAGLLIFALGSIVAALAASIEWVIIGRAIQGAGAISAAVLALTADLTREEQRTKAMAMIGMSIGMVFLLSMSIAPPLAAKMGVAGLFWMTAVFSVVAIGILHWVVPNPQRHVLHRDVTPVKAQIGEILRHPQLLRLDFGIFVLHLVLTALFVVLPGLLAEVGGLALAAHWKVYLPLILLSVLGMLPLIMIGSRKGKMTEMFRLATAILCGALLLLALVGGQGVFGLNNFTGLLVGIWLFFVAFNALEAMLPSLVSRVAPAASKGTAIGVYNSLQFFGMFVGGITAGVLSGKFGAGSVFWFCSGVVLIWFVVSLLAPAFSLLSSRVLSVNGNSSSQIAALVDRIGQVKGVHEVTFVPGETLAYLKVDENELDNMALQQLNQT